MTQVAVYYFPGYHPDPRTDRWHGRGWSEWDLVKRAEPRFEGHVQPKAPLWGYEDESTPAAAQRRIAAAADHHIDAFIYDWYWYDGPFLNGALDRGYLAAPNNDRLKFGLMWANHDWLDIHPRPRNGTPTVLAPGAVTREQFDAAIDHIIERYFKHPSYWRVNGGLYFSFYELMSLIKGLGGADATRAALATFRDRTRSAGLGELHLNAVVWGIQILPNEKTLTDPDQMVRSLGFDSVTSYVWVHHQPLRQFPKTPYAQVCDASVEDWRRFHGLYSVPYFPNVTMGWDASPRTIQSDRFDNVGYPWMATLDGNTPQAFERALTLAHDFLAQSGTTPPILTINAWNEWTEGSYLEPDTVHGMAYLEAIARVFRR